MNTSQINACLKNEKQFVGSFPCNYIKVTRKRPAYYVINTSRWQHRDVNKIQEGQHWVVVVLKENGKGLYFDSFGLPPLQPDIITYLEKTCPRGYKYNTQTLQNPSSSACGVYCADFIANHSKGVNLRKYLSNFTSDSVSNDKLVVKRTTCLSSISPPLSRLNLKTLL